MEEEKAHLSKGSGLSLPALVGDLDAAMGTHGKERRRRRTNCSRAMGKKEGERTNRYVGNQWQTVFFLLDKNNFCLKQLLFFTSLVGFWLL